MKIEADKGGESQASEVFPFLCRVRTQLPWKGLLEEPLTSVYLWLEGGCGRS